MAPPLSMVGIGCGPRTCTYCGIAAQMPQRYIVVGGADPIRARVERLRAVAANPAFRAFRDDRELFAAGRIADLAVIGTQDRHHVEPALRAMELGYDLLLEKPIAPDPRQVMQVLAAAERLGRKVLVCHVLRYTPFYVKVKELLASGVLGDIASIDASEGVGDWHQVHSFVRGHWAVAGRSNPMIIAKSCHDMDIISWMVDRPCRRIASFGGLHHFTAAKAPAGAPARCDDGCPVGDTCRYNAIHYTQRERNWAEQVMDDGASADPEAIKAWLKTSPWGRCAWRCDNDVVDRQVLAMEFADGITGTFTMTAFDQHRAVTIRGTKGVLSGGGQRKDETGEDILVRTHQGEETRYRVPAASGGYAGHGGGDPGLVLALDRELAKPAERMRSGLHASVESHIMGFAAEEARLTGTVVDLAGFRARHLARP
jgi:predicted dehydrogenase